MKPHCKLSKWLCLFLLTTLSNGSEAQTEPVSIGFINAVGLPTRTTFLMDGQSVKPAGFPQGNLIESLAITSGSHRFSFSNGDAKPLAQEVQVTPGVSPLYVLYKTTIKEHTGKFTNVLKMTVVPPQAKIRGRRYLAFYASEDPPINIRVNGSPVRLDPLKLVALGTDSLTVETDAQTEKYNPLASTTYILVVFQGTDNKYHQRLIEMVS